MAPLIELSGITKSYGHVDALNGVDLTLHDNEIIGLIGDNGAGKSTLIKILSGVETFDKGTMRIGGAAVDPGRHTVKTARDMGIETVFQDKSLGESQPIWRNFFMGRHRTNPLGMIRVAHEKKEAMKVLTKIIGLKGAGLSADAPVSVLSGGERQGLAIGRAMYFNARVVILDEPTTALAVKEVDKVLGFAKALKTEGKSGIFVSHNLHHVHDVVDRFLFLQRGRVVHEARKADETPESLMATLMKWS
ncbi:ATP-binding cassette domain-containing protein [Desulfoluna butyratoxydans]|uniref:Abc transporter-like n=1 Tax=Desulfoluna butyratoxydans TaxID=231438 RepID=A0A4U8YN56_9BACT|nr:ATP-binding cassette domain-containing protein [Desulfoluna butyratoxydans]VFQ44619.1 abc transporter-like [Desulfoluna butyratoxydans]